METKEITKIKEEIIHDDLLIALTHIKTARDIAFRLKSSEELSILREELDKIQEDLNKVGGDLQDALGYALFSRLDDIVEGQLLASYGVEAFSN